MAAPVVVDLSDMRCDAKTKTGRRCRLPITNGGGQIWRGGEDMEVHSFRPKENQQVAQRRCAVHVDTTIPAPERMVLASEPDSRQEW